MSKIKCAHCGETRRTWSLWRGFAIVPGADVLCCLLPERELSGKTYNRVLMEMGQ